MSRDLLITHGRTLVEYSRTLAEYGKTLAEYSRTWQNTADDIPSTVIAIAYYRWKS